MNQPARGEAAMRVYEQIKEMILTTALAPGQRVAQRELEEQLNVGRTPVREALRMLEASGYLTSVPNHGIRIAPLDFGEVEEAYATLLMLEAPALLTSAPRLSAQALKQHRALAEHLRAGAQSSSGQVATYAHDMATLRLLPFRHAPGMTRKLLEDLYDRLNRSHRAFYQGHRLPEYVFALETLLGQALTEGRFDIARRVVETRALTAAIGLLSDADPSHSFETLAHTASACGIHLDLERTPRLPIRATWEQSVPDYEPTENPHLLDLTAR